MLVLVDQQVLADQGDLDLLWVSVQAPSSSIIL